MINGSFPSVSTEHHDLLFWPSKRVNLAAQLWDNSTVKIEDFVFYRMNFPD